MCLVTVMLRWHFTTRFKMLLLLLHFFYQLCPMMTYEAAHLLSCLLRWTPSKRISCTEALRHVFIREGRLRYHSSLCCCCWLSAGGMCHSPDAEFEPSPPSIFDDRYEASLDSIKDVQVHISRFINASPCGKKVAASGEPFKCNLPTVCCFYCCTFTTCHCKLCKIG